MSSGVTATYQIVRAKLLLDSNIIIYATKPEYAVVRQFIAAHSPAVSAVSYVEVLGFHRLATTEKTLLEAFFATTMILPLTQQVLDQAVLLRQQRRMTLGDALVAGTALSYGRTLVIIMRLILRGLLTWSSSTR